MNQGGRKQPIDYHQWNKSDDNKYIDIDIDIDVFVPKRRMKTQSFVKF